jgi:magnesium-transporting ATPase (P-type)
MHVLVFFISFLRFFSFFLSSFFLLLFLLFHIFLRSYFHLIIRSIFKMTTSKICIFWFIQAAFIIDDIFFRSRKREKFRKRKTRKWSTIRILMSSFFEMSSKLSHI